MANYKNIIDMGSLIANSIRIYQNMIVVYPNSNQQNEPKEEPLNITGLAPKFEECYSSNNSIVCYISKEGIFVIPYSNRIIKILHDAGYVYTYFEVPFSNGEYPKDFSDEWKQLCKAAEEVKNNDFENICNSHSDRINLGTISGEILSNCFMMPENGVEVMRDNFKTRCYPIITQRSFDNATSLELIGIYCKKNGIVVFSYRNGKTYVAKGEKIEDELRLASFRKCELNVPFSGNEKIVDPELKRKWQSLKKF